MANEAGELRYDAEAGVWVIDFTLTETKTFSHEDAITSAWRWVNFAGVPHHFILRRGQLPLLVRPEVPAASYANTTMTGEAR